MPRVLGMRAGQPLDIANEDDRLLQVHAFPTRGDGFTIGLRGTGRVSRRTIEREEVGIPIRDDVRSWMRAFVGVFAHPRFGVTGADGSVSARFRIRVGERGIPLPPRSA